MSCTWQKVRKPTCTLTQAGADSDDSIVSSPPVRADSDDSIVSSPPVRADSDDSIAAGVGSFLPIFGAKSLATNYYAIHVYVTNDTTM